MTWRKLGLAAGFIGAGVMLLAAESKPPATSTEPALMRAKLASTQKIVEGLMAREFKLIVSGAQELEKICEATEWRAEEDQVYAHYRSELRRTSKKLAQLAQDKDQDGATYTYMHTVTTCISCHDYCRDVLHVAHDEPKLQAVPPLEKADEDSARTILR
jgi:hypothetical protein